MHAGPHLRILDVSISSDTAEEPLLSTPATYSYSDHSASLASLNSTGDEAGSHPALKRKTWAAYSAADQGELAISVSGGWVRLEPSDSSLSGSPFAPIEIRVDYALTAGSDELGGVVFRQGDNSAGIAPHIFVDPTARTAARMWTPCVDHLWERCTWELEVVVPKHLAGNQDYPITVVCSGELVEQIEHPHASNKTIFYYLQTNPTSVQHVAFAAGPFDIHQICDAPKPVLAFCLPGFLDETKLSTAFIPSALSFISAEYGSYPFTDYKLVFVESPSNAVSMTSTLTICSTDLLHPTQAFDQAIITRETLSLALVEQWIGVNIIPLTLADTWLINGIALYLRSLLLKHMLGNNEYRFRLKRDIDRCVHMDQGDQWPLCVPGCTEAPPDMDFCNLKAPLVLHLLDRHIAKAGTSLGLPRIIPRIFLSALSDELKGNELSTTGFFRICRKISGLDLSAFQDQWVFGSGCPHFRISTNFIRKKFIVELSVEQLQPAVHPEEQDDAQSTKRPTPFFDGSLTIRIHEADGAPFEHLVDIRSAQKTFALPFNTKYKRTRRSGLIAARFKRNREDAIADYEAADESDAQLGQRSEAFAYAPWDNEEERARWRVADWSDEQAEAMMSDMGGYEWLRVDPDFEWLAHIEFQEKPWYWISQLEGDRDVTAQLEAIQNMSIYPFPVVATALARTVLVTNYFYRVRMEAARALLNFQGMDAGHIGRFYLLKLYEHFYCANVADDPFESASTVLPPNRGDMAGYFVQKALLSVLSTLRPMIRPAQRLLVNTMNLMGPTSEFVMDHYLAAAAIAAVGNALSGPQDQQLQPVLPEAKDAIDRLLTMDRLVPSYHNVVAQAALKSKLKFILAGHQTNEPHIFLPYTREGNYNLVRRLAFDCLIICSPPGRSEAFDQYYFDVVKADRSISIRRHVARSLVEGALMWLAAGDMPGTVAESSIVEDTGGKDKQKGRTHIVKAVRKEYGRREHVRRRLSELLGQPSLVTDESLRLSLLKFAEITSAGASEPIPGNVISLSLLTPSVTPIATPRIRLSLSGDPKEGDAFPFSSSPEKAAPRLTLNVGSQQKKKSVPKSQTSGLPANDVKIITVILRRLQQALRFAIFRTPVDPVRDRVPDYLTRIKKPMDMSLTQYKLDNGLYTSRQQFYDDIQLIVDNCIQYNGAKSPVGALAKEYEKLFNSLRKKSEETLSRADQAEALQKGVAVRPTIIIPPSAPKQTVKIVVPPMAPPPVPPPRKPNTISIPKVAAPSAPSRKRKEETNVDDVIGVEVDAIGRALSPDSFEKILAPLPKKLKISAGGSRSSSPVKQADPRPGTSTPPALIIPTPPAPLIPPRTLPPANLPPTANSTMPFRSSRGKGLVLALQRDRHAGIASVIVFCATSANALQFLRPVDPVADGVPT